MNQITETKDSPSFTINAINSHDVERLELFAEELPTQHDLRMPDFKCTLATLTTWGSCAACASSFSC